MINAKLQNIIDTKSAIGNAIVNKGGTITSETPFYEYAPAIENLSTGGGSIPAYSNFAMSDENSVKYEAYNGYDFYVNPTPDLTNLTFNEWYIKNDTTRTQVITNAVVTQINTVSFVDNTVGINDAYMPVAGLNQAGTTTQFVNSAINNGFIYYRASSGLWKFHENNLISNNVSFTFSTSRGFNIVINDGAVFTTNANTIRKLFESNLANIGNTATYLNNIFAMAINNSFLYVGGQNAPGAANRGISKYHEGNLTLVANSSNFTTNTGLVIATMAINNGIVYAAGGQNAAIRGYYEDNLAFAVSNLVPYTLNFSSGTTNTTTIAAMAINNGYIYIGGNSSVGSAVNNIVIRRLHESNLTADIDSPIIGENIHDIKIDNGYVYVLGNLGNQVYKFYESNLQLAGQTNIYTYTRISSVITKATPLFGGLSINNGFLYTSARESISGARAVYRIAPQADNLVAANIYTITKVKE
jgi:hypothetical protein